MNDSDNVKKDLPGFEPYLEIKYDLSSNFDTLVSKNPISTETKKFDPYKLMIKKVNSEETIDTIPKQKWPEEEIKALKNFCEKNGIVGFNAGQMPPIVALAFLKNKLGIVDVPLKERIPYGYQQISGEKKILHG
jgi:hypothetical protein